jgi:hypothetical protein
VAHVRTSHTWDDVDRAGCGTDCRRFAGLPGGEAACAATVGRGMGEADDGASGDGTGAAGVTKTVDADDDVQHQKTCWKSQ